jgi:glutathione S-transferase
VLRFAGEAHPGVFDAKRWPALAAHAAQCEALPPFQQIAQPFSAPGE